MNYWLILFCLILAVATQCPSNCLFCISPPICSLCQPTYALNLVGNCTLNNISNCRVYASASACQLCEATYVQMSGRCVKDYSGCVSRTIEGVCNFCGFGTVLSGNTCKQVLNCEKMDSNGLQCVRCYKGYRVEQGKCVQNRTDCVSQSAGVCTQCAKDYVLNGFSCLKLSVIAPNCELYDPWLGWCMYCSQGYEMQYKHCKRLDQLTPVTSKNIQNSPQKALAMQEDVLDDPILNPLNKATSQNTDNLNYNFDFDIQLFSSSGSSNSKDTCWLKAADGSCRVCKEGYVLSDGVCTANAVCLKYGADGRSCQVCNVALVLEKGWCNDVNCGVSIFSRCSVCKQGAYKPNAQGICVNVGCINFAGGKCLACSSGLSLDTNGLCVQSSTQATNTPTNPTVNTPSTLNPPQTAINKSASGSGSGSRKNCDLQQGGRCVRCAASYFPDDAGGCKRVVIGCLQFDKAQENCIQCLSIYSLDTTGGCVFGPPPTPTSIPTQPTQPTQSSQTTKSSTATQAASSNSGSSGGNGGSIAFSADANCNIQNKGSCAVCKLGFVLNLFNFSCIPVPKQCATYNTTNGNCLTCVSPYLIFNGWCILWANSKDPACSISTINNFCSTCKSSYYLDRGSCKPFNSLCKTSNLIGGGCLSCYSGYILFNSNCISISQQPACMSYDFNSICSACYNRFYLSGGVCLPVSPLCFNYNGVTGQCVDCIAGYAFSSITGGCEVLQPAPPNCAKADPTGKCIICNPRYFINSSGFCQLAPNLCQNYNQNGGACTGCFPNYKLLADGSCLNQSLILGCTAANSNGYCQSCLTQYVLTLQGSCLLRDPYCLNYTNGACTKCTIFYYMNNGICIKETLKAKDPNCIRSDIYNYCQTCIAGYYISQGNCLLADQNCKTFDPSNGNCLSCYDGYRLNNNKCYLNNPINNCQLFNGIVCQLCQSGYKLAPDGSCISN